MNLKGLYAITDDVLTPFETIKDQIEIALQNGVRVLQFRDKKSSDSEVLSICSDLKKLCDSYGALFVLDDRIDIARELGAALHIGKDDISLVEARKSFDGVIGVSCYGDINRAIEAESNGASYVAFGSFFKSQTKPNSEVVSFDVLVEAKQKLQIPICVIGGINISNIDQFNILKPDMISVVNGIFAGDIAKNCCDLLAKSTYLIPSDM